MGWYNKINLQWLSIVLLIQEIIFPPKEFFKFSHEVTFENILAINCIMLIQKTRGTERQFPRHSGGAEVSLTDFFLTVYLWENCSKNNISWNNLAFFWDFPCSLASVTIMSCNLLCWAWIQAILGCDIVWHCVTSRKVCWFVVQS